MNIYDRDYRSITEEERKQWDELKEREIVDRNNPKSMIRRSLYRNYPSAVRHYLSLFPSHFLDPIPLSSQTELLLNKIGDFETLINNRLIKERDVLNHINERKDFFIIGSIVNKGYNFGHHALYIFPEFKLGVDFQVDYLLVGKNSHGYNFVFVELESVLGKISLKDGDFGQTIRMGISQVNKWKLWLEENFSHLRPLFEKYLGPVDNNLPREFSVFDRTRMNYVVVAGRRKDYNDLTRRLQRESLESNIRLLHYDNLVDNSKGLIGCPTY